MEAILLAFLDGIQQPEHFFYMIGSQSQGSWGEQQNGAERRENRRIRKNNWPKTKKNFSFFAVSTPLSFSGERESGAGGNKNNVYFLSPALSFIAHPYRTAWVWEIAMLPKSTKKAINAAIPKATRSSSLKAPKEKHVKSTSPLLSGLFAYELHTRQYCEDDKETKKRLTKGAWVCDRFFVCFGRSGRCYADA